MIRSANRNALLLTAILVSIAPLLCAQKTPKVAKPLPRTVWNLEGGAFFATDGHLPGGACFRLFGQANAPGFFDNLKRVDDDQGTSYRRDNQVVTEFPDQLDVVITIRDSPCSLDLRDTAVRPPLTRQIMSTLRLKLYWKRGVALRPAENLRDKKLAIKPIETYVDSSAENLPQRYEWTYTFAVPTAGVPIDDSLVFTIETPDGRVAARTAARL